MLTTMFTLAFAAATGCAVDAQEDQAAASAQEPAAENTATDSEALRIGGDGVGGTSLWCACKLNCENDHSGIPVLIKACKAKCDADNKCRKGVTGGSGGLYIY